MGSGTLKRGDIILFATGKPRPGVIVQADGIDTPIDILICPFSTTIVDAPIYRLPVEPSPDNGLTSACQIMVDKVGPTPRSKIGNVIGRLAADDLLRLDLALIAMLELGG